jgi:hypothetical protein
MDVGRKYISDNSGECHPERVTKWRTEGSHQSIFEEN